MNDGYQQQLQIDEILLEASQFFRRQELEDLVQKLEVLWPCKNKLFIYHWAFEKVIHENE